MPQIVVLALLLLSALASPARASSMAVSIPIETFHRRPQAPAPLSATLRLSPDKKKSDLTRGRAVLLLPDLNQNKEELNSLAAALEDAGFDVLTINFRSKIANEPKLMLEDVQSSVVFLKSNKLTQSNRVSMVGFGAGAAAAAQYAGATKQMLFIVDAIAFISPSAKPIFLDSFKNIVGIPALLMASEKDSESFELVKKSKETCATICKEQVYSSSARGSALIESKLSPEPKTLLMEFLLKPNG